MLPGTTTIDTNSDVNVNIRSKRLPTAYDVYKTRCLHIYQHSNKADKRESVRDEFYNKSFRPRVATSTDETKKINT